jgi:hypothetical protein
MCVQDTVELRDRANKLFSLKGAHNADARIQLYEFMARQLSDEEKFLTQNNLVSGVLAVFVDERLPLTPVYDDLLEDALRCLSSDALKLLAIEQGVCAHACALRARTLLQAVRLRMTTVWT